MGQFYNLNSEQCESCPIECKSGGDQSFFGICVIRNNEPNCLLCDEDSQFRDLQSWDCNNYCKNGLLQVQSPQYEFFNYRTFKYCRNTSEGYYIDSTSNLNIELGTIDYPFRMLDDPFREVFNNDYSNQDAFNQDQYVYDQMINIYIKANTTLNIYTEEMPLLLLNHNFSIIKEIIVTNIQDENLRAQINIYDDSINIYKRTLPLSVSQTQIP
eukprot:403339391